MSILTMTCGRQSRVSLGCAVAIIRVEMTVAAPEANYLLIAGETAVSLEDQSWERMSLTARLLQTRA